MSYGNKIKKNERLFRINFFMKTPFNKNRTD